MSKKEEIAEIYQFEDREWLDSLDYIIKNEPADRVKEILGKLYHKAQLHGIQVVHPGNTAYINTIPPDEEEQYPGDRDVERRIKSIIRWNAMAMVVRANREYSGIGGHISTYASAATLYEVGFQPFLAGNMMMETLVISFIFKDMLFLESMPGHLWRAGLTEANLEHFRREGIFR
jgi:pyruvate dehydrogenase E1 component